jgi:hypothetical protein
MTGAIDTAWQLCGVYALDLRRELMPPILDEATVLCLAKLASRLDGAYGVGDPPHWEDDLAEFNRIAGTSIPIQDFQGIYGAEEHDRWVRRVLYQRVITPAANVTPTELAEVVRRAMPATGDPDYEAYMAIFDANVPMPSASNLIFYPPDYDEHSNTWDCGRPIEEYDPTPEQIVEWALNWQGHGHRD